MTAMPSRASGPERRLPIEIPIPKLARASGYKDNRRMVRRLREAGVVLRQRGAGTKRRHQFVTHAELQAAPDGHWILEAIQDWEALLVSCELSTDDGDEEDE